MIPDEILGIALTRSHLLWLALFGVIGISLLAGSVSLWLFHRRIAGPIRKLEAQAERIGHGDYRPLPQLTPHNDLARLGKALNSMAQAIARHEHHIRYLALHEQVTGLPNRAAFLEAVGATPTVGAVLVVALERAHEVANTVGREIADRVLRHVALRLGRLLGDVDLACLGEPSFAVGLPEAGEQKARGVAADIVKHFEMPYTDGDLTIDTVVAVGIALAPQH